MRALRSAVVVIVLLLLAVGLSAAYILVLRPMTLPVYTAGRRPSTQQAGFIAATLILNDLEFIHDRSEVPLEPAPSPFGFLAMIGRTADGLRVHAVPGQSESDWVTLTSSVFPRQVFRNAVRPPVDLATLPVYELELPLRTWWGTRVHRTRRLVTIREVLVTLVNRLGATTDVTTTRSAQLRLISRELAGMYYVVNVCVTEDGQVYLAERAAPDDWVPAGPALTAWLASLDLPPVR